MSTCISFFLSFLLLSLASNGQQKESWIDLPKEQWPQIALTNHVLYKNGDRYVAPSFSYAGTGFLINTGNDTLAATAKHILWIAKNKKNNSVQINRDLQQWLMMPKGDSLNIAVIDSLINEDSTEVLDGAGSTILERDMLIFSVKSVSPDLYPLKPRYTNVKPGEKLYILSCDYTSATCQVFGGAVLKKLGMDILIERDTSQMRGGSSGSPVIDANGFLVGVISSASSDGESGKNVAIAISTEYLLNVLEKKPGVNTPKKTYGDMILKTVLEKGSKAAIDQYKKLESDPRNYYTYNLRNPNRDGLRQVGEDLLAMGRMQDGIDILHLNLETNPAYFANYNVLAKAYLQAGRKEEAIKYYRMSIEKMGDRKENEAFEQLSKLEE